MSDSTTFKELIFPEKYHAAINISAYRQFLERISKDSAIKYAVFHLPSPWTDLLKQSPWLRDQTSFRYYWEQPSSSFTISAGGRVQEVSGSGSKRFQDVYTKFEKLKTHTAEFNAGDFEPGIHLLGGFSFFNEMTSSDWSAYGSASFTMPKYAALQKKGATVLSIALTLRDNRASEYIHHQLMNELNNLEHAACDEPENTQHSENELSDLAIVNNHRDEWTRAVLDARQAIAGTALEKVVLARELKLKKQRRQQPNIILDKLRMQYPNCSTFYIQKRQAPAFIGCSPEKLLSFNGNTIQTEALAGSIGRGNTDAEDTRLANTLLNSPKNKREHSYVVKSIEQDLSASAHNLKHRDTPVIKKLANVQHLYTPISAEKRNDVNPLSLLSQLHPTPAVGGYPRKKAINYIRKHESLNRGWFAGPVGWMNSRDEGEFTVAIRSGLIKETEATLFAGCGLVADSDPDKEWQETNLKFMPMLSALNYD